MSDHPTFSTPNGASVAVTIPPGWSTHVSALARNKFNQMISTRLSNSTDPSIVDTDAFFYYPKKRTPTNETMRLASNSYDSYSIPAKEGIQHLELTAYYSKDKLEDEELVESNAVVTGLRVCQAETPAHLLSKFPNYITFFVFVQASPDQKETEHAPLYNDAICTINLIKGTGLDHNGTGGGTEVLASGHISARPTYEAPAKNSVKINVPAGWYGSVAGISRAKYNQIIKIGRTNDGDYPSTEFLASKGNQTDDIMRVTSDRQNLYLVNASKTSNVVLDTSFFWSKGNVEAEELDNPQYSSQKLKVVQTQTPLHLLAILPDCVIYFIMAEDQPEADQVVDVPAFNDCIGVVTLIKKTHMVYNDEE